MHNLYDEDAFFEAYAMMPRSREGLAAAGEWHQLRQLFPDVTGKHVLDLGCGYGWHCKYAAEHGAASVLGIDISERMIETARQRNADPVIAYRVCSIEQFDFPKGVYDLVVSNLALHYVEDLNAVYRNVYATLKNGGVFLINVEHPVFTAGVNQTWVTDENGQAIYWPVDDYYSPGWRQTQFLGKTVLKYHHTLTQIVGGLCSSGFELQVLEEAVPAEDVRDLPEMKDEMRRPMMLLLKAQKPARAVCPE